ncbi:hypothetical protein HMPREF9120_02398 [Neisseria sp. oral taxon 020 str. F0370]|nr:hypothetical protein HMPREF9120_02398 [Neisseria sp. oral taxon 020 str. F0370]
MAYRQQQRETALGLQRPSERAACRCAFPFVPRYAQKRCR